MKNLKTVRSKGWFWSKFSVLIALFTLSVLGASAKCELDYLRISTGYDPTAGSLVGSGANDPKWQVIALSPAAAAIAPATPPYSAINIKPNIGWVTSSTSNWISFIKDNHFDTDPNSAYSITYRRPFRMCQRDAIKFDLQFACDNCVTQITVDGVVVFSQPINNSSSNYTTFTPLSFSMTLNAGVHNIDVVTYNLSSTFSFNNPYGLNFDGNLYSATGSNSLKNEYDACDEYTCGGCAITDIHTSLSAAYPGHYTFTPDLANPSTDAYVIWDFGDGTTATTTSLAPGVTHVYGVAGTYKVCAVHYFKETGEKCELCFELCVAKGAKEKSAQERRTAAEPQQGVGALYPNPANTELNIPVSAAQAGDAEVIVRSMSGAVVSRTVLPVTPGNNVLHLPLAKMPAGSYSVDVKGSWGRTIKPFSKL